jgi:hypothetical protein
MEARALKGYNVSGPLFALRALGVELHDPVLCLTLGLAF